MNKFLTSVANVYGYTLDDQLLFTGKTLLDSSIEQTISNTDIRGGQGNQLLHVLYHSAEFTSTITESQFSLDFLALNAGSSVTVGSNMYIEESVTLVAGAGSVLKTPIAPGVSVVYGWVLFPDGTTERVTFTNKAFSTSKTSSTDTVCVRYYTLESSAREVKINANMMPSTIKLVMEASLCSSDATTNKVGTVQIIVPKAKMTGAFTLSMTPDAVASTPLSIRALAYSQTGGGCSGNDPLYARIIEKIDGTNWYDTVEALGVIGGNFALPNTQTKTLQLKAIPSVGMAFTPPYSDLTFVGTGVTVNSSGVVTGTVAGGTVLVTITSKPTVELTIAVTPS